MDGRSLFREVMAEAGRLGLSPWERLALILVVALLSVMGRRAWEIVRRLPSPEPFPDDNRLPPMPNPPPPPRGDLDP